MNTKEDGRVKVPFFLDYTFVWQKNSVQDRWPSDHMFFRRKQRPHGAFRTIWTSICKNETLQAAAAGLLGLLSGRLDTKSTCTSCNDFNEVLFHRVLRGRCDQGQKKQIKLQVRNEILTNFVREGSSKYVYTYFKLHEANDNHFDNSLCLYWMRHVSDYQSKSENADKKQWLILYWWSNTTRNGENL